MDVGTFEIYERKIIIKIKSRICETPEELLASKLFREVLMRSIQTLAARNSNLLSVFASRDIQDGDIDLLIRTFEFLTKMAGTLVPNVVRGSEIFFRDPALFNDFVEYLYNYWRSFDRIIICDSEGEELDKRAYRVFNTTIEYLTRFVRKIYRDIQANITNRRPSVYRQVRAGAEFATIVVPKDIPLPGKLKEKFGKIPIIRQVMLYPPLILKPPMNKRSGKFERVTENLVDLIEADPQDWLCYPAKVGPLVILIYFHKKFQELGLSLCNLFEIADDADLARKPDAVYFYGTSPEALARFGTLPTVFYDDEANDLLIAAIPNQNEFGYFGYLKKMTLTLHNIKMMKMGKWPFHGALVNLTLRGDRQANVLFIGDTGAGKSETLEALREIGKDKIQDMIVIADDMGSLAINPAGEIIGYGTEIGAFLRLDDLEPGFAFGQIDRAIIMSAGKVNARIILPVTTYANVVRGCKVHMILYVNNYEEIDEEHPVIERFTSPESSLQIFREGTVMSKGTTTSTGIVHSYFANIFGPPQYKDLHNALAQNFFRAFHEKSVFVGQMRTRLGIAGCERKGPEEAARELLQTIEGF